MLAETSVLHTRTAKTGVHRSCGPTIDDPVSVSRAEEFPHRTSLSVIFESELLDSQFFSNWGKFMEDHRKREQNKPENEPDQAKQGGQQRPGTQQGREQKHPETEHTEHKEDKERKTA